MNFNDLKDIVEGFLPENYTAEIPEEENIKNDKLHQKEKKKEKKGGGMCVYACVKYRKLGYGSAAISF